MIKPTRLFDYIDKQVREFPQDKAISHKKNGKWIHYSSSDFQKHVNEYSLALLAHGVKKDDKIAIISGNRPEWNFCDNGILQIGAVNVPIYPTSSVNDFEFILNNAGVKYLFISDESIFEKASKANVPSLQGIYSFDEVSGCKNVTEFLAKADRAKMSEVDEIKNTITSQDLATIIYTSGTTGNPKGVMLSHRNIIFNVEEVSPHLPVQKHHKVLSFLPLCHIFERVVTYFYFFKGVEVYYAESIDTLKENIAEVKPHFMTCVPRLMEKIYDGILAKGKDLKGISKLLFNWGISLAHKENASSNLFYGFLNKVIYSKFREALGGNIVGIVTGAAALQARIGLFFNNVGILVREGYGMTETAPVISFNRFGPKENKPGSVGVILDNVTIKLEHREGMQDGEGEILVQGENVMMGYYNNPEATSATIKDGWLYTGDVGRFDDENFLHITDRVKELFKTSGGKYVAPQFLENTLKESKYIEQIMVIGNNRKFVSALIYPSITNLKSWAEFKGYSIDFSHPNWTKSTEIIDKIKRVIDRYNIQFNQVEQIKKFTLVNAEWTIDGGELTPTLKLKRKILEEKNSELIESMYKD
jgi:long-chain acyl-CoA synthetase